MKKYALRGTILLGILVAIGVVILAFFTTGRVIKENNDKQGNDSQSIDSSVLDISYDVAKDSTYTLIIKNPDGEVLLTKAGLKYKALPETTSDTMFSLSWTTGTGANDFETVYCDLENIRVSQVFTSPFACNGTRVVLPQGNDEEGYSVLVRDVFDDQGYSKTYPLADAYIDNNQPVIFRGKLLNNSQASVSYFVGANGEYRTEQLNLYAEEKTTESTTEKK